MTTLISDTHRFVRRLAAAGMPEKQAEALAEELRGSDMGHLATRADLGSVKADLISEIQRARADLFKWIVPLLLGQAGLITALVKLL